MKAKMISKMLLFMLESLAKIFHC